ncbi:hypothetical protein FSP39_013033 [Pinctada imbricata]|uniref:Heat shock 70 kDa protein 12A n=1 Tax=Pinctada imbricata TaxID=66713 RepID=A0AA88Y8E3_PINIB|nr:hypothetical protein FSP39_013033 [Pinctada imbricata]
MAEENSYLKSKSKRLFVAAIDFGTTLSGYAFSSKSSWHKVHTNTWCGGSLISIKAPTALLLDSNKEFVAFGYEAEDKYSQLAQEEEHEEYYFFHRFKMALHNEKIGSKTMIKEKCGKEMEALNVFRHCVEYLKDSLFHQLEQIFPDVEMTDLDFVLTVPAIWDDASQQFMREAANQAGIKKEQLTIAIEPEAAFIYCQHLGMDQGEQVSTGTKYIVVDLGGGTADFTVYQKCEDNTLEEVQPASGGPWGGKSIDDNFEQFLKDIIGPVKYENFKENNMEDYIDLFRSFETKKRTINPDLEERITGLFVPPGFTSIVKGGKKGLETVISQSKHAKTVTFEKGKFKWKNKDFANFFNATIQHILGHIEELFQRPSMKDVKTILMVGGFSECKLVQVAIRNRFPEKRIFIPEDSGLAVLKGAVYVGHVPVLNVRKYSEQVPVLEGAEYLGDVQYAVSLRAPRYSFGMQSWPEWNRTNHPHSRKTRIGDKDRCADVFLKYSTKGEYISPGTKRSHSVHAVKKEDYLECAIYTSDKEEDPKFTDEVGCRRFCLIRVDLPNLPKGATMEVQGTMIFGWKELRVQITDLNSRQLYADVTFDLN